MVMQCGVNGSCGVKFVSGVEQAARGHCATAAGQGLSLSLSLTFSFSLTFTFPLSHHSYLLYERQKVKYGEGQRMEPLQVYLRIYYLFVSLLKLACRNSNIFFPGTNDFLRVNETRWFRCESAGWWHVEAVCHWLGWLQCAAVCSWSWAGCARERVHADMTLCRNFRATTGGLSELVSNPANPARNTVIKSASLCRHCHTQPLPPTHTPHLKSLHKPHHPIMVRPQQPFLLALQPADWRSRRDEVVGGRGACGSVELCHDLEGVGCSGFGGGGCGGLWVGHFFCIKPLAPLWNGHSKATLQLNGENSNAPLETQGIGRVLPMAAPPVCEREVQGLMLCNKLNGPSGRHQHTLTWTPDSLAAMLLCTPHTPVGCRQIWKIVFFH